MECKTRREKAALTIQGLHRTLARARVQLPKEGPGIIFIFIPLRWTQMVGAEEIITKTIQEFLRNTKRVNQVFLMWRSWVLVENRHIQRSLYKTYLNSAPRTSSKLIDLSIREEASCKLTFIPSFL